MSADWLIPDWPAPSGVKAVFTTRSGGVSVAPWDSLNLGDHVGDDATSVNANRAVLQQACGTHAVFLKQVHGMEVLKLDAATPNGSQADACVSSQSGIACTIMVADCLPVLLTTQAGTAVAAAHAGWRGLAGDAASGHKGVLEAVMAPLCAAAGNAPAASVIAWLGPCIGPSAFEVGGEVKLAFEAGQPGAGRFFVPATPGKYLADLAGLARQRLQALGVTQVYGNDGTDAWCTVRNPAKYFSHRRDAGATGNGFGTTGRMGAFVWRT
ncbi:MAG: peptidoglycan editing factor PgeF [Pseudomonadota bacterium]